MNKTGLELSFSWEKAPQGYKWEKCEVANILLQTPELHLPEPPYLVQNSYKKDLGQEYSPDYALFANFAEIDANEEAFVGWANKHGMLLGAERVRPIYDMLTNTGQDKPFTYKILTEPDHKTLPLLVIPENPVENPTDPGYSFWGYQENMDEAGKWDLIQVAESLDFWKREHCDLSFATKMWDLWFNQKIDALKGMVECSFRYDTATIHHENGEKITLSVKNSKNHNKYDDVLKPALDYIQMVINKKSKIYPSSVVWENNAKRQWGAYLRPTSLLAAMWCQFALVFNGEIELKRCKKCKKWESMRERNTNWTKHRECYSSKERMREYRARKKALSS